MFSKRTLISAILATVILSCLTGCVNVYTRCPWTDERVERMYQCTGEAYGLSLLISFPQAMSDGPSRGFMWENLLTIPLGCIGLCDTACEAAIDTVLLPADWTLARQRNKKNTADKERN